MRKKQYQRKSNKEKWLEENREAIEKQNERIRTHGSFSDDIRRF
jgi:post-segregation antitoxin (ccd killing protein)